MSYVDMTSSLEAVDERMGRRRLASLCFGRNRTHTKQHATDLSRSHVWSQAFRFCFASTVHRLVLLLAGSPGGLTHGSQMEVRVFLFFQICASST